MVENVNTRKYDNSGMPDDVREAVMLEMGNMIAAGLLERTFECPERPHSPDCDCVLTVTNEGKQYLRERS